MHVYMNALVCGSVCSCAACKKYTFSLSSCKLIPPALAGSLCREGARRRRRRRKKRRRRELKQEGKQAERDGREAVNANKPRRNRIAV